MFEVINTIKGVYELLAALNDDVAQAETRGDTDFFKGLLAPAFAMRRANGKTASRDDFIQAVGPSAKRRTELEAVTFVGVNRTTVASVVTMDTDEGPKRFHNLRLFTGDARQLVAASRLGQRADRVEPLMNERAVLPTRIYVLPEV